VLLVLPEVVDVVAVVVFVVCAQTAPANATDAISTTRTVTAIVCFL
jgi:hypothetical protein